jgi:hypothetical protein
LLTVGHARTPGVQGAEQSVEHRAQFPPAHGLGAELSAKPCTQFHLALRLESTGQFGAAVEHRAPGEHDPALRFQSAGGLRAAVELRTQLDPVLRLQSALRLP